MIHSVVNTGGLPVQASMAWSRQEGTKLVFLMQEAQQASYRQFNPEKSPREPSSL